MFNDHYIEWREKRLNCIFKYINYSFFLNKNLIEFGCGFGNIGNHFYNIGSIVTSTDVNEEYLKQTKNNYPHLNVYKFDGETDELTLNYDIAIHLGTLNHINNLEKHLINVCKNCNYIILDLEIADSLYDEYIQTNIDEYGYDQSYHKKGSKPSANYIENILSRNNFKFKIIKDPILNTIEHNYTWTIKNSESFHQGQSRFWICWKNDYECPIYKDYIEDVSIILQGKLSNDVDIYHTLSHYIQYGQVILSIYRDLENINIINRICNDFPSVHIVNNNIVQNEINLRSMNKFSGVPYHDNCYHQICTTINGLRKVISKYVIKSRPDHYYSSLSDFIIWMIHQNKIISSSVYLRGTNYVRYHLSDMLFGGNINDIKKTFELAFNNYYIGCPEIIIWKPFLFYKASLENINLDNLDDNSYAEWMAKNIYVYCINRHQKYRLKCNGCILTNITDRDKTKEDSKEYFLLGMQ